MRVGMGYDVHKLTENRDLILGGVNIPWEKGLLGHSDADVLIHAVMDALLGAAALGDIGKHFPDTDPAYKGISSVKLLTHVMELLRQHHFAVGNVDAVIIAQKPIGFWAMITASTFPTAKWCCLKSSITCVRSFTLDIPL